MRKAILLLFGLLCLIAGFLTVWTPLPTGVPLIALAVVVLVGVSRTARGIVRRARDRYDWIHGSLAFVEARASRSLSTPLRRTRPLRRRILSAAKMMPRKAVRPPGEHA